jgi:DNA polymerase I-like protein with 3'-5' exonuclease and polymerase domains
MGGGSRGKFLKPIFVWDCEWEGKHPHNPNSYLRTIQIAWDHDKAVCFKISHAGGALAFRDKNGKPAIQRLAQLLNELARETIAVGHFLVADLEWLHYYGIYPEASIPLEPEDGVLPWELFQQGRGFYDTALALHALEETASLGLEVLTLRFTSLPRYDLELEAWKTQNKDLCRDGYGNCPDSILFPYGMWDVIATYQSFFHLLERFEKALPERNYWIPFWESSLASWVILDIHKNGIRVDKEKVDKLSLAFTEAKERVERELREYLRWPDFNPRSVFHIRECLYGPEYNGAFDKDRNKKRLSPLDANLLYLQPIIDTSKPSRLWSELVAEGKAHLATPATNKTALAILLRENPDFSYGLGLLRDQRFLDQVLKTIFRPPLLDDSESLVTDEDGFLEYEDGIAAYIDCDGRVRTNMIPTAETGRWKSSRPNLHNLSKQRDADYTRLLKEGYKHKIRSILIADGHLPLVEIPPRTKKLQWISLVEGEKRLRNRVEKPSVLIEFDYTGAELYAAAILANDKAMIDHAERALYPDSGYDASGNPVEGGKFPHPKYYDIHSNIAVLAFNLKCPPTKAGLKSIGAEHFRVLAKNVIFGVMYGRGAKAISLQAKENGNLITVEQAQNIVDTIFKTYPKLPEFFAEAKERVRRYGWLVNSFGRYRHFPKLRDKKLLAEAERQAMNFPVQSLIASCMTRGLAYLKQEIKRQKLESEIQLILQIHDAGMLNVSISHIEIAKKLVNLCFREKVPIFPTDLSGKSLGTGPYFLGLDIKIEKNWGEEYISS